MTLGELLILMAVAAGAYFVWANLRAREAANAAIREACALERLWLLNDTVGLVALGVARDASGRLRLKRVYGFEYSDTGLNRRRGSLTMLGESIAAVDIGARLEPEGETLH